jgi:hypothetical protein
LFSIRFQRLVALHFNNSIDESELLLEKFLFGPSHLDAERSLEIFPRAVG